MKRIIQDNNEVIIKIAKLKEIRKKYVILSNNPQSIIILQNGYIRVRPVLQRIKFNAQFIATIAGYFVFNFDTERYIKVFN